MQKKSVAILVLAAALAVHAREQPANAGRDHGSRTNTWRMQVGWVHQWGRGMSVRGPGPSLPSGSFQTLTLGGRPVLSVMPALTYPNNSALIAREFDDGYVRPDLWTGDAGVPLDRQGMTWNWGADSASQYDPDGGVHPTLTYSIDRGAYIEPSAVGTGGKSDDDLPSDGVEVKASRLLHSWASGSGSTNAPKSGSSLDLSLVVGLAWFSGAKQKLQRTVGQRVFDVTDTYTYLDYYGTAAGGSSPPLAGPYPYAGTYAGPGSLIPETPESSTVDATTLIGTVRDSVASKSRLWRLRGETGIELSKQLSDRLNVYVSPQLVVEFVDMHAERAESVTFTDLGGTTTAVASRSDRSHKMAVVPGFLLTAGADYQINTDWYAGASVGWEWLAYDPSINVGSDKVQFDLNGGEFSLYIGRRF